MPCIRVIWVEMTAAQGTNRAEEDIAIIKPKRIDAALRRYSAATTEGGSDGAGGGTNPASNQKPIRNITRNVGPLHKQNH